MLCWFRRFKDENRVMLSRNWEPVPDADVPFDGLVTKQARVTWSDGKMRTANIGWHDGVQWARVELDEVELLQAFSRYHLKRST